MLDRHESLLRSRYRGVRLHVGFCTIVMLVVARATVSGGAHGAIKLYLLVYTTCTRVQTISLNPYIRTCGVAPSVQVYARQLQLLDNSHALPFRPSSCHYASPL